jgi:hypothetical protein
VPVFLASTVSESINDPGQALQGVEFLLSYESDASYRNIPELDVFLPTPATPLNTPR